MERLNFHIVNSVEVRQDKKSQVFKNAFRVFFSRMQRVFMIVPGTIETNLKNNSKP